jgi:hypothetical protein
MKQWNQLVQFDGATTDVVFGDQLASYIATVGMDRSMKFYSAK